MNKGILSAYLISMTHQTRNTLTLYGGHMETFLTLNITIHKIIQQVTCSLIFIYKKMYISTNQQHNKAEHQLQE